MNEIEYGRKKHQVLKDFIKLYENFPCLWRIKSREYHDRALRAKAYKVLIQKLQQIQPGADRPAVVKKINCLRSNYRKEQKKTLEYRKNGKIYTSKLWYYSLFSFLGESATRQSTTESQEVEATISIKGEDDNISSDPLDNPHEICEDLYEGRNSPITESIHEPMFEPQPLENVQLPQPSSSKMSAANDIQEMNYVEAREDKHDIFGKNVAMKLRYISSINDTQRIMAEKIINEALYMAEIGILNMENCKVLQ